MSSPTPNRTTTPTDLTITPRDLKLDRNASHARWWHGGDPVATAFFNALSAAFPQGETFFIDAVRRFRDRTDGKLQQQIAAFIQQEAAHTREHVVFNRLVKGAGYDTAFMDAETRRRLDVARSRHPVVQLAITVALEHFTAIMANFFLPYLSFFRPGFHPWDHDDGALVKQFEQRLRLSDAASN
jgi:uncharacterized protein